MTQDKIQAMDREAEREIQRIVIAGRLQQQTVFLEKDVTRSISPWLIALPLKDDRIHSQQTPVL